MSGGKAVAAVGGRDTPKARMAGPVPLGPRAAANGIDVYAVAGTRR